LDKKGKKIRVHLQTVIEDGEEKESHSLEGKGELYSRGSMTVIKFLENSEDEGEVSHLISIYPKRVNVNRKGQVQINQQFILNKQTENKIELPQGNIVMDIFTQRINHKDINNNDEGKLRLHYEVLLNGQIKRNHRLTLSYYKEDVE